MIETRGAGCLSARGAEGLSTMTSSQAAQRAAQWRGARHRDDDDARVRQVIAARQRLSTARLAMTLPHRPVRDGDAYARALERLDMAVDEAQRSSEEGEAAHGRRERRNAAVALAAANEQVAAREAWVKYIEHGH
jgi:hypothetical protein